MSSGCRTATACAKAAEVEDDSFNLTIPVWLKLTAWIVAIGAHDGNLRPDQRDRPRPLAAKLRFAGHPRNGHHALAAGAMRTAARWIAGGRIDV
jgi:hypothetical protein